MDSQKELASRGTIVSTEHRQPVSACKSTHSNADCRVCNRRRIKCDRRAPSCAKCEKRGLTCSGYGVFLKWDQGVASRGNLKGKSLPIKGTQKPVSSFSAGAIFADVQSELEEPCEEIQRSLSPGIRTIPTPLLSFQLQNSNERRLLYHYDQVVASNMAWADCPENPWRHIIIPMALESPPLMNAILAFAAKHINAVSFSALKQKNAVLPTLTPGLFQQKAMMLLAQEVKDLADQKGSPTSVGVTKGVSLSRSNAIMATMLVLCNVETVWPGQLFLSSQWHFGSYGHRFSRLASPFKRGKNSDRVFPRSIIDHTRRHDI